MLILIVHGGNGSSRKPAIKKWQIIKNQFSTNSGKAVWSENLDQFLPRNIENYQIENLNPVFPNANDANFEEWQAFFEQIMNCEKTENLILVGHSLGTTFLQLYLAQNNLERFGKKILQLHLVGTCLSSGDFGIGSNWQNILGQIKPSNIFVYHSRDDLVCEFANGQIFAQNLGCNFEIFENRGHFLQTELPELIKNIKHLQK